MSEAGGCQASAAKTSSSGLPRCPTATSAALGAVRGGSAKHVLVIGSEKFTDILDPYDRGTAFLFGDGAGAAVIGVAEQDGIGPVVWSSDGDQADVLRTESYPPQLRMEGRAVYRWATSSVPDMARKAVAAAGMSKRFFQRIKSFRVHWRADEHNKGNPFRFTSHFDKIDP